MKFEEALKELGDIAAGRYHSMQYGLTVFQSEIADTHPPTATCVVYIDGEERCEAGTWREALDKMRKTISGMKPADPGEAPATDTAGLEAK